MFNLLISVLFSFELYEGSQESGENMENLDYFAKSLKLKEICDFRYFNYLTEFSKKIILRFIFTSV